MVAELSCMSDRPDIRHPSKPLVFVHIAKTAGTAFTTYLARNLKSEELVAPIFVKDYGRIDWANAVYRLYYGHFLYREVSLRIPNAYFLTFLRHPIKRVISIYRFWSELNGPGSEPFLAVLTPEQREDMQYIKTCSLDEFLLSERPMLLAALTDQQTFWLSSSDTRDSPTFLSSAMENLNRFTFFGIQERFAESIRLFQATFRNALDYNVSTEDENRSSKLIGEVSEPALARLEALNCNDFALYKYAVELFHQRCELHGLKGAHVAMAAYGLEGNSCWGASELPRQIS